MMLMTFGIHLMKVGTHNVNTAKKKDRYQRYQIWTRAMCLCHVRIMNEKTFFLLQLRASHIINIGFHIVDIQFCYWTYAIIIFALPTNAETKMEKIASTLFWSVGNRYVCRLHQIRQSYYVFCSLVSIKSIARFTLNEWVRPHSRDLLILIFFPSLQFPLSQFPYVY